MSGLDLDKMTGKEKPYLRADSVDGRNPAPPVMYKTIKKKRETTTINYLSTGAGILPSTVCHGSKQKITLSKYKY